MVCIVYNGILLGYKKEWTNATCSDIDGHRDVSQRQILYDITYMWTLKDNTNEFTCKTETDLQT